MVSLLTICVVARTYGCEGMLVAIIGMVAAIAAGGYVDVVVSRFVEVCLRTLLSGSTTARLVYPKLPRWCGHASIQAHARRRGVRGYQAGPVCQGGGAA